VMSKVRDASLKILENKTLKDILTKQVTI